MKRGLMIKSILFARVLAAFVAGSVLLFACASMQTGEDPWIGKDKSELLAALGKPARMEPDGKGGQIWIYLEKVEVYLPGRIDRDGKSAAYYGREKRHTYMRQTRFYLDEEGRIYRRETRG
jgi:hypothetical protein